MADTLEFLKQDDTGLRESVNRSDPVFTDGAMSSLNVKRLQKSFADAKPFRHVVIDNLFHPAFLEKVLADFSAAFGDWVRYNTANEVKAGTRPNPKLGAGSRHYFDVIQRGEFTQFLSAVSGIDGLLPDPTLFGGGLHEISPGGHFGVHIDFNKHPVTKLDNRLVFITYLNRNWDPSFGGALELWDTVSGACVERVQPEFGRSILFAHSDTSLHGHPHAIATPDGRKRRSVAAYYYTNGRGDEGADQEHTTKFFRTAKLGGLGRLVGAANYVSPMLTDGVRMLYRSGTKLTRTLRR